MYGLQLRGKSKTDFEVLFSDCVLKLFLRRFCEGPYFPHILHKDQSVVSRRLTRNMYVLVEYAGKENLVRLSRR